MKSKRGITLLELSLTLTLASILLMNLFYFSQTQRHVCRRLHSNTAAIFLLESMRNFVKGELDRGATLADITSDGLKKLIDKKSWVIGLELVNGEKGEKLVLSLFNDNADGFPCTYATEVSGK